MTKQKIPTRKVTFNLPTVFAKLMDEKIKRQVVKTTQYLVGLVRADVLKSDQGTTTHGGEK